MTALVPSKVQLQQISLYYISAKQFPRYAIKQHRTLGFTDILNFEPMSGFPVMLNCTLKLALVRVHACVRARDLSML